MVIKGDLDARARLVAWGYVADRYAIMLSRLKTGRVHADAPEFRAAASEAKKVIEALAQGAREESTPAFDSLSVHGATANAYYRAERKQTEDWTGLIAGLEHPTDIDGLRSIFDGIGSAMGRAAQQLPQRQLVRPY